MQCDRARNLMSDVLDGRPSPELERHVASCSSCSHELRSLQAVDLWLRTQPQVEPPPHFASRAMSYIDRRLRVVPRWQRTMLQVGAIASGTLLVAIGVVAVLHGGRTVFAWLPDFDAAGALDALGLGVRVLADRVPLGLTVGAVAAGLSIVLAVIWFGALVVPRHGTTAAAAASRRR